MDAAKLRELQQRAHELMELLRSGREGEGDESALSYTPHILELARVVYKVDETSKRVTDDDVRKIWEKRATWLHQELQRVLAERLQAAQQAGHDFWDACVRLLYASASSLEAAHAERAEVEARLKREQTALAEKEAQHHAVAQEALEMRTKLALKGQEAAQQEADHRELLQRLQAALRERDALRAEKAQLLEERETNREHMSRQTEVISQLMERNEAMSRDKVESLKLASKTESDNHVLRVNLGQHGQVVEKLIHLNAELMEEKNARTVAKVREAAPDAATQQGGGEMGQQGAAVGADASSWPHTHDPPRPGQGTAAAPGNAQGRSITGHNPSANKGAKSTQPLAPNGHAGAHPSGEQLSDRRVVEIGSDDEPLLPPSVPAGATTPPLSQGRWAGGLSAVANGWMGSRGVGAPVGAGGADVAVSTEAGARSLVGAAKVDRDGQGGAATKGLDLEAGAAGQTQRVANPVTHPRPIKWTSDALPLLRQNQPQGGVMGDRDGTDSEGSGRGAGAMGNLDPRLDAAWSKVKVVKQGVAGKTRGLMSYIVGADVAQSVN
eukprot:jgi/Mesvir1/22615/Mv14060-RA.1